MPQRIESGIIHVLSELTDEGHACYPYDALIKESSKILEVHKLLIEEVIEDLGKSDELVIEENQDN